MASASAALDPAAVRRIARLARIRLADEDVAQLQTELGAITTHHVNFRIFDTTLAERSAKFSTQ